MLLSTGRSLGDGSMRLTLATLGLGLGSGIGPAAGGEWCVSGAIANEANIGGIAEGASSGDTTASAVGCGAGASACTSGTESGIGTGVSDATEPPDIAGDFSGEPSGTESEKAGCTLPTIGIVNGGFGVVSGAGAAG